MATSPLLPAGVACGIWDGRRDRLLFFERRLGQFRQLRLDNREIIAAQLILVEDLGSTALTRSVSSYLGRTPPPSWHKLPSPIRFTTRATPPVGPKRARLALQLLPTPGLSQTFYNGSLNDWDWPEGEWRL